MDAKNQEKVNAKNNQKKSFINDFFEKYVVSIRKKVHDSCDEDEHFQSDDCGQSGSGGFSKKRIIILVLASFLILISAVSLLILNEMYAFFKYGGQEKVVEIPYGSSTSKIAYILNENDIIAYPWIFSTYASFSGQTNLKHGAFKLNTSMNYD